MSGLQSLENDKYANLALVAVGANLSGPLGTPEMTVSAAIAAVGKQVDYVPQVSQLFRTPAYPAGSGPDFVNAAFVIEWAGTAQELLDILHSVEAQFGRVRDQRWEARILDLDLLALGAQVVPDVDTQAKWRALDAAAASSVAPDRLILPHPRLQDRAFVLVPLCDIAHDWCHPLTGHSIAQMRDALPEKDLDGIGPL